MPKSSNFKLPKSTPANDSRGWNNGERGFGEASGNRFENDRDDFIGSYDRDADAAIYGNAQVGRREPPVRDPSPVKGKI